jgi:hypothetical protein
MEEFLRVFYIEWEGEDFQVADNGIKCPRVDEPSLPTSDEAADLHPTVPDHLDFNCPARD